MKEQREQLKTIKDAIRYQKLLLSAEHKRKKKKEFSERNKKYQNIRKELETRIKEHPVTVERKKKREVNKPTNFTLQVTLWKEIDNKEEEKTKTRNDIKTFSGTMGDVTMIKLLKEKNFTIKAPQSFKQTYNNTYTFQFYEKYLGLQTDKSKYVEGAKFHKLLGYLKSDKNFKKHFIITFGYIDMIEVTNVVQQESPKTNFNPVNAENFKSSTLNSICFKYIDYNLNKNAKTFSEMLDRTEVQKDTDVDNSCYVNLIVNTYNVSIQKRFKPEGKKAESNKQKLLTAQSYAKFGE